MKNEKGAITLITIGTIIFILVFLISSFVIISNKLQAQTAIKKEIISLYENEVENVEKIYSEYYIEYIEYIESTGTQYINTEICPTSSTIVRLKFNMTSATGNIICGYYNSEEDSFRFFNYQNQAYLDYGSGSGYNRIFGGTISAGITYDIEFGNRYVKNLDTGENIISSTEVSFSDKSTPIGIFGLANLSPSVGKIYYCQIYNNGILVRDLRPALDDNDVPCLYDKVTKQYFYNSGTGTFNYN